MPTTADLVSWARRHAAELETDMTLHPQSGPGYGPYWKAQDLAAESRIRARAIQALDFLDRYAGSDSQWAVRGHDIFDKSDHSMETGARDLGDVLRAWADQVETGLIPVPQAEAESVRAIASTDLMEQVRKLMEDKGVHPAAPIMLAGAAMEIALRSAVDELGLPGPDKPSIATYCECLRTTGVLTKQDVKDVTQMAGVRNSAAHGDFDELDRARAGLMEQQVNLFLSRLAGLLAAVPAPESTSSSELDRCYQPTN